MRISHWSKVDMRFYLGVKCKKCGAPILFALDHSEAESKPASSGKLVLTCSLAECRHQADYTSASVSRFQKQQPDAQTKTGGTGEGSESPKYKRRS